MLNHFSLDDMNRAINGTPEIDSVHHYLEHGDGETASNTITLTGTGAQVVNIFQLTGTVEVFEIHGGLSDVSTFTNCTGAHWELWDGAASVDISKNDGVLSGMALGTYMARTGIANTTMGIADNAAGSIVEGATGNKAFQSLFVTQKTGQDTFIRFAFSTTDNPIVATIDMEVRFSPHENGVAVGTLVAV